MNADEARRAGGPQAVGTVFQRLRARALGLVSRLLVAIPEPPVNALGEAAGELWYRVAPARADRARRNFRRVAAYLAARNLGTPLVRAAADDPAALDRLVRRAFRHAIRYYLDMVRLPGRTPADLGRRLEIETPEVVEAAFAAPGALLFVAMHFGAVEFPGLFVVARTGRRVTAPMETLDDPALQAWIVATRSSEIGRASCRERV